MRTARRSLLFSDVPQIAAYHEKLQLWTCYYESLSSLVSSVLAEVLDETACEVLCLLLPLCCISISVAWVENYADAAEWEKKAEDLHLGVQLEPRSRR